MMNWCGDDPAHLELKVYADASPATSYGGSESDFDQDYDSDTDVEWSNEHHNDYEVASEGQVIVDYDLIREIDVIYGCPSIVVKAYVHEKPRTTHGCRSYNDASGCQTFCVLACVQPNLIPDNSNSGVGVYSPQRLMIVIPSPGQRAATMLPPLSLLHQFVLLGTDDILINATCADPRMASLAGAPLLAIRDLHHWAAQVGRSQDDLLQMILGADGHRMLIRPVPKRAQTRSSSENGGARSCMMVIGSA
jgi:hypothetical protein